MLTARYARLLAGWNGEVDEEFRRKLRALRALSQDIVELRRGDHSAARLKIEQARLDREEDWAEEELIEHFRRWAENPKVREWICGCRLTAEEKMRWMREIFGLGPDETTKPPASSNGRSKESNPIKPNQTA